MLCDLAASEFITENPDVHAYVSVCEVPIEEKKKQLL